MKTHYNELSDIRQQIRQHGMLDEQATIDILMTLSCRLAVDHQNQFIGGKNRQTADMLDDIIGYLEQAIIDNEDAEILEKAETYRWAW